MARIGLSKPYYAKYTDNGDGTVTYSDGGRLSKAVETHLSLNDSGENILYADNGPAESEKQFAGGTLTVVTDELPLDAAAVILGLETDEVTVAGDQGATGTRIRFNNGQEIPYVGYGVIVQKQIGGSSKYMAVIFPKVQFSNPNEDYITKGERITWQTPTLTATVMRDDTEDQNWRDWVLFDKESHAEAYIKQFFKIASSGD